jgi:hypothetical protein
MSLGGVRSRELPYSATTLLGRVRSRELPYSATTPPGGVRSWELPYSANTAAISIIRIGLLRLHNLVGTKLRGSVITSA